MSDHEPVLLPPQLELRRAPAIPPIVAAFGVAAAIAAGIFAGVHSGAFSGVISAVHSRAHRGWFESAPHFATAAAPNGSLAPIDISRPGELARAIAALRVDPAAKEEVRQEVLSGRLQLGAITVWDYKDEDGDEVTITSAGFSQPVPLWHEPTTVVVPYRASGATIAVTGLKDGINGITAGVSVAGAPTNLPPLYPGDTVQVVIP